MKERKMSREIFRHMPAVRLTRSDGSKGRGQGTVTRLKEKADRLAVGNRHETGELSLPLYVFTGWLDKAEPGDVLEQGEEAYTVLRAEDCGVCARVFLERRVSADGGA